MNPKIIKWLKHLSTGLVVMAVVFAFLITGIRIFGVQVFGVLTGSMEPTYPTGSLIYVKDVDAADLRVNDVITFSLSPNVIATHRIVEVVPDESNPSVVRFRTKGDANDEVDASLVSAVNIIGKVMFAVPQLGYLASYIQEPPGIYVAILVCALMIGFVFYTDSLENRTKQTAGQQQAGFAWMNRFAGKLSGKPPKKPQIAEPAAFQQGYVPQQPMYGAQNMYPQQGYAQPGYVQQPYPQGYPQPYPQQTAPQAYGQPYQQPVQQPYPQQGYAPYPPQQAASYVQPGYQQQSYPTPQMNPQAGVQAAQAQPQRRRRTERS